MHDQQNFVNATPSLKKIYIWNKTYDQETTRTKKIKKNPPKSSYNYPRHHYRSRGELKHDFEEPHGSIFQINNDGGYFRICVVVIGTI